MGLADAADRRVKGYSMGMRQRLAIAAALLGDPKVLILDEPTNGLDPPGISWMRGLVRAQARNGRAVLVSSHLLAEVAQSVDDVVVIAKGELRGHGTLEQVLGGRGGRGDRSAGPRYRPACGSVQRAATVSSAGGEASSCPAPSRSKSARPRSRSGSSSRTWPRGRAHSSRHSSSSPVESRERLLRAELLKLRTTRTFAALVGSALALSLLAVTLSAALTDEFTEDEVRELFTAHFTGLFIMFLGVMGMAGEWRHRTITSTVLAAPDRVRLVAAKTLSYAIAGVVLSLIVTLSIWRWAR